MGYRPPASKSGNPRECEGGVGPPLTPSWLGGGPAHTHALPVLPGGGMSPPMPPGGGRSITPSHTSPALGGSYLSPKKGHPGAKCRNLPQNGPLRVGPPELPPEVDPPRTQENVPNPHKAQSTMHDHSLFDDQDSSQVKGAAFCLLWLLPVSTFLV